MKVVSYLVSSASVEITTIPITINIGKGICILIGFGKEDTPEQAENFAKSFLRKKLITKDESNNKLIGESGLELLCISQFTLTSFFNGNRIDFHSVLENEKAKICYDHFINTLRESYSSELIKDGIFGVKRRFSMNILGPLMIEEDILE